MPRGREDAGFTLVEVIVALGILMLLVTVLLPQLVVGIRSTSTSRLVSQSKGLIQAELEVMRNLPYHVSFDAGDYRDVLDFYYKNLTVPTTTPTCQTGSKFNAPQTSWTGYVAAGGTRCSYEPATGAFYRTVRSIPAAAGISAFTLVIDTQFLSAGTPPVAVTPPTGYTTMSSIAGFPASAQIGVTVTALFTDRATLKPTSMTTQIAQQASVTTRARGEAAVNAVEIGSVTSTGVPVSLTVGQLSLTGSLTNSSNVLAALSSVSGGLGTGERSNGASSNTSAPPARTAAVTSVAAGTMGVAGCDYSCWGASRVDAPELAASGGLPNAGTVTSPAQALLTGSTNNGFSFGNSAAAEYKPDLLLSTPLVRLDPDASTVASGVTPACALGTTGTASFVTASGFVRSTEVNAGSEPTTVESCGVSRASTISLFPTTFAPRGVVLITLTRASARCKVTSASHTASVSHDYQAVVRYFDGTAYKTLATITPSTTTDPLQAVDLATTATGDNKFLADYISSWSALTAGEVTSSAAGGLAQVKIPGVVKVVSQPVRTDDLAAVSLAVGSVSCLATDAR